MPELHDLKPNPGTNRHGKRKGRGPGSGKGKTAGRGHKGQKARSGGNLPPGFEGGQMPLQRRLPKRGFKNFRRVEYQVVNVRDLERASREDLDPEAMKETGLIGTNRKPVKVLGMGELTKALHVTAHAFSASARDKIEAAGGTVTLMVPDPTRLMEGRPELDSDQVETVEITEEAAEAEAPEEAGSDEATETSEAEVAESGEPPREGETEAEDEAAEEAGDAEESEDDKA